MLREIRDELKGTNARLDGLSTRVDDTNARLQGLNTSVDARLERLSARVDDTNARLERIDSRVVALGDRQTETEVRLATEIIAVARAVGDVRDLLRDNLVVRAQVDDHERRLTALERRGA